MNLGVSPVPVFLDCFPGAGSTLAAYGFGLTEQGTFDLDTPRAGYIRIASTSDPIAGDIVIANDYVAYFGFVDASSEFSGKVLSR